MLFHNLFFHQNPKKGATCGCVLVFWPSAQLKLPKIIIFKSSFDAFTEYLRIASFFCCCPVSLILRKAVLMFLHSDMVLWWWWWGWNDIPVNTIKFQNAANNLFQCDISSGITNGSNFGIIHFANRVLVSSHWYCIYRFLSNWINKFHWTHIHFHSPEWACTTVI